MEKTFNTRHGEVLLRNAMIDTNGTNLADGIEIKINGRVVAEVLDTHTDISEMTDDDAEKFVDEHYDENDDDFDEEEEEDESDEGTLSERMQNFQNWIGNDPEFVKKMKELQSYYNEKLSEVFTAKEQDSEKWQDMINEIDGNINNAEDCSITDLLLFNS